MLCASCLTEGLGGVFPDGIVDKIVVDCMPPGSGVRIDHTTDSIEFFGDDALKRNVIRNIHDWKHQVDRALVAPQLALRQPRSARRRRN